MYQKSKTKFEVWVADKVKVRLAKSKSLVKFKFLVVDGWKPKLVSRDCLAQSKNVHKNLKDL